MSSSSKQHVGGEKASLRGVRVLLVEDTWHVAQALKSVLQQMGMVVLGPAGTTAAAKRLAAEHTPSIAVVDVNLGGETSCALIEELCDQNIRVIVISGYAMPPVRAHKTAAILQKPFSASEFLAALQSVAAQPQTWQ